MNFRMAILMLSAATLLAQNASLTGRITDSSGALVPGAKITAKNSATSVLFPTETNGEGYYSLPALPPATYELEIAKDGFVTVRQSGLELIVQQAARLDVTLKPGGTVETVQVSASALMLESENATVGQAISSKQIRELPLLGRNTYALAMLVPGVRPSAGVNNLVIDQISTVAYSINGNRPNANEFLLDGAPNSAAAQNQPVINANPDMVQEFKVETNSFSAEYGRAAGGVFNVVTRSGANDLSFSLYEFFRNDKLNANDWFANRSRTARAPFKFNQFGGTLGGPVVIPKLYNGKNKTFFFFNTEIVRFVQGVTYTAILPDPSLLNGDFSRVSQVIYDPATTRPNPSGSGFLRTAFPGNLIPGNRIDPVSRRVSALLPRPNISGTPLLGAVNYAQTDGNRVDKDSWSLRLDHNFSEKNRIFGRYSFDDTPFIRAPIYGIDRRNVTPTAGPQIFTRWNSVIEDTHVFSPTFLATFRGSVTRLVNNRRPWSDNFDITSIGLPAYMREGMVDPLSFPAITITGYQANSSIANGVVGGIIGATDLISFGLPTYSAQSIFTKTLQSHTMKFGAEYRVIQFNSKQTSDVATNFAFNPQWTQGPNPAQASAAAGLGLATFLLGIPAGSVNPVPALALTNKYYGFFFQDTWKVSQRLTLNLGIRYDYETPRTDRFDQLANFDFNAASPLTAPGLTPRGGLTYVNTGGLPRYNANPDRNNIAPRAGLAYKINPRTVFRAGGGVFYAGLTGVGGGAGAFGTSGFQAGTSIVTSVDGVNPIVSFSDPYPQGFNRPTGSQQGLRTLAGQSIQFYDRNNVVPKTFQWNATLQRELPKSIFLELGYVGTRAFNLFEARQWNTLDPALLAQGDALRQTQPNPFRGQIAVGTLAQANVTRAQLLRPFPQFDAVQSINNGWANSSYHGFTARAEKRMSGGLTVIGSYTYSKTMDYGIGPFGGETVGGGGLQNWHNLTADWSASTLDQTNRWIVNAVYELPFARNAKGVSGAFFKGWQLSGIWSAFSGGPLGIGAAVNNTFSQGGGQRPNWTGVSAKLDNPTPTRWFDTTQFTIAPAYTFGNVGRTLNGLRSDGVAQFDTTLSKNTRVTEKIQLQFRAEVYNISNSARFAPPNATFGNPQFGVVAAQGNQPRVIQFGLKLLR